MFNKKVPLGIGLATLFIVSSCIYSIGYKMAMNKFNNIVSDTSEKQKMYSDLSEIDYNIRNEYIGNIDTSKISKGISNGYFSAVEDDNCKLLNKNEYQEYLKKIDNYQAEISWDELENSIGYLSCKTLGKGASDSFLERLDYFNSKEINKVILDLRLSEQGNIEEVFKILQSLLPKDDDVYLVNKSGKKEVVCKSEGNDNKFEFIILTSEFTSGPSEVLALSLKNSLGSKVIGELTSGNTIRNKTVEVSEDCIIVFPDAKYTTFDGIDIYKDGLSPDETVNVSEEYIIDLENNTLSYADDEHIQKAIDIFST